MSFIEWLVLGLVAYASGFGIRHYQFRGKSPAKNMQWLLTAICFTVAIIVFTALNYWVLKKAFDIMFVVVSSLVATGIFYYGLSTDTRNTMQPPE